MHPYAHQLLEEISQKIMLFLLKYVLGSFESGAINHKDDRSEIHLATSFSAETYVQTSTSKKHRQAGSGLTKLFMIRGSNRGCRGLESVHRKVSPIASK